MVDPEAVGVVDGSMVGVEVAVGDGVVAGLAETLGRTLGVGLAEEIGAPTDTTYSPTPFEPAWCPSTTNWCIAEEA